MKTTRLVVSLHGDPVLQEKLRRVARQRAMRLQVVADWEALLDAVRAAPASALIVVDPYFGTGHGAGPSPELAALLHRFPSLAVTAALSVEPGRLDDVRRLGTWGVVQVLDLSVPLTALEVGLRLLEARGRPLRSLVQQALPASAGGTARSLLAAAATVVSDGGSGEDLARALHVTRRTLTRWCRRAALPPPRRLLAWMRILLAAELLDDPGRSVLDVALSCGYASDSSLRLAMRTFLDTSPSSLRERGAFRVASQRFLGALADARRDDARYRTPRPQLR